MRLALAGAVLLCALALAAPAFAAMAVSQAQTWHAVSEERERREPTRFAVPLRGPLHSPFGYRWGRLHRGIDIAVLHTDVVRAALPGVVTSAGYIANYSGYGLVVRVSHGGGLATMYAHLASAGVKSGQKVGRGEPIARAGCTGSCTGPHLHFEVMLRGKLVDPLKYLRGRVR